MLSGKHPDQDRKDNSAVNPIEGDENPQDSIGNRQGGG
jgi:hypothetical protein